MLFYGQLLIKHKLLYILHPIIVPIISNFYHMLVLIGAFQKYYGLPPDFLLISAIFAFLSKFKPYSTSSIFYLTFIWRKNNEQIFFLTKVRVV